MTHHNIRSMTTLTFHPFVVRTASGESYPVAHPELVWIDPDGDVMLVKVKAAVVLIDIDSVTGCVRQSAPTEKA